MGGSGSKSKGLWPFTGSASSSASDPAHEANEQSLARLRGSRSATPFVFTRRSSLYYDEDGDLAHEFYEETVVTKNGRKRAKLKRIQKNLIPQGIVKLDHPRIHVDFPVVLCEVEGYDQEMKMLSSLSCISYGYQKRLRVQK
ncbi:tumor suppressor candidate 2 [Arapaima gigas]